MIKQLIPALALMVAVSVPANAMSVSEAAGKARSGTSKVFRAVVLEPVGAVAGFMLRAASTVAQYASDAAQVGMQVVGDVAGDALETADEMVGGQ